MSRVVLVSTDVCALKCFTVFILIIVISIVHFKNRINFVLVMIFFFCKCARNTREKTTSNDGMCFESINVSYVTDKKKILAWNLYITVLEMASLFRVPATPFEV